MMAVTMLMFLAGEYDNTEFDVDEHDHGLKPDICNTTQSFLKLAKATRQVQHVHPWPWQPTKYSQRNVVISEFA